MIYNKLIFLSNILCVGDNKTALIKPIYNNTSVATQGYIVYHKTQDILLNNSENICNINNVENNLNQNVLCNNSENICNMNNVENNLNKNVLLNNSENICIMSNVQNNVRQIKSIVNKTCSDFGFHQKAFDAINSAIDMIAHMSITHITKHNNIMPCDSNINCCLRYTEFGYPSFGIISPCYIGSQCIVTNMQRNRLYSVMVIVNYIG